VCEGIIVDSEWRVSAFPSERKGGLEITGQIRRSYERAGIKNSRINILRMSVNALDLSFALPPGLLGFWCAILAVGSVMLGSLCN
jgi:hypothetical protein